MTGEYYSAYWLPLSVFLWKLAKVLASCEIVKGRHQQKYFLMITKRFH